MTDYSKALLDEMLKLNAREKVQIVDALLASLDKPDAAIDKTWADEVDERVEALRAGDPSTKSAIEVLGKYKYSR